MWSENVTRVLGEIRKLVESGKVRFKLYGWYIREDANPAACPLCTLLNQKLNPENKFRLTYWYNTKDLLLTRDEADRIALAADRDNLEDVHYLRTALLEACGLS